MAIWVCVQNYKTKESIPLRRIPTTKVVSPAATGPNPRYGAKPER